MEVSVLAPTAFDQERVPKGFSQPPVVAVVLPTAKYVEMMQSQEHRSFSYHILTHAGYNMLNPLAFDADVFVQEALDYCKEHKVEAVMAFDCFPTMLASVLTQELRLPGPSSWSVFLCINKYYMRRELTPNMGPIDDVADGASASSYPAVLKVSDTQFYVGTRICPTEDDWKSALEDARVGILSEGLEARQEFYYKWAQRFEWPVDWSSPSDVRLVHGEPKVQCKGEYQAEVVVLPGGELWTADTGDIEHSKGGDAITLFKTPGTFTLTPILTAWLRRLSEQMVSLGYKSAAMDIEFMRLNSAEEAYELIEINSRYSYMGNYMHYGLDYGALSSSAHVERERPREVRNMLNRTRLALGSAPAFVPCRDSPGTSKLAAFLYTDHCGPVDKIFDSNKLKELIEDGMLDAFAPKPVFAAGVVTEADLRAYNGWAKIGCMLMTWEDNLEDINSRLESVLNQLSVDKSRGFLAVRVVDEDGAGPTHLEYRVLQNTAQMAAGAQSTSCCCVC